MRSSAKDRVRQTYNRLASVYDRRWARYIRATTRATLARLALRPGEHLLDVGCGTGALLLELVREGTAHRLSGVDLSPAMLTRARATLPRTVHLVAGDSEALPWPASSVDVIVSCSSFHYWADPEQALREVRRVLRPGGRLVITDWCSDYWVCRVFDGVLRLLDPTHSRIYGKARCRHLLDSAGLTDVEVDSYRVPWPWGMMTATARAM